MTPAHKLQVVRQYVEQMETHEWAVISKSTLEGFGLFHKRAVCVRDLDQFLMSLKSSVWLGKITLDFNSTTAVDLILTDGTHITGVAALYGITLFMNHQCNAKLAFDEQQPKSDCPAQTKRQKLFVLPLKYADRKSLPKDPDAILFDKNKEILVSYAKGELGFVCGCTDNKCHSKLDKNNRHRDIANVYHSIRLAH